MSFQDIQNDFIEIYKNCLNEGENLIVNHFSLDGKVNVNVCLEIELDILKTMISQSCMLTHEQINDSILLRKILDSMFKGAMIIYETLNPERDFNNNPTKVIRKPWRAMTFN